MSNAAEHYRLVEVIRTLPPEERAKVLLLLAEEPEMLEEVLGDDSSANERTRLSSPDSQRLPSTPPRADR